jgi:glycine hydroxymethyltransferase
MSELSPDYFTKPIADVDPEIAQVLRNEAARQESTLEMISSENFVPQAVLDCQGSVLTNKYAEGYPGKRYYGGCEYVDVAEQLAIDRAKELFGAEHVNVQPHSGAQANSAAYMALLDPGDRILGMKLDHGGHLTHGMKINFSGLYFDIVGYGVREEDSRLDMDELQQLAEDSRPKMILAGWSAYSRQLDFRRFREIADSVGAILMADMAHFAGLVAAEQHPSPVPWCDVVTTTTHKTLGGARGGMILCKEEYAKKINSRVFPGHQGGPLMHVIAGKAVALKLAQTELFRERQTRTRQGAAAVGEEMLAAGVNVLTGGTDVHHVLADLRDSELDGKQAEDRLAEIGITVNRNAVPFDPRPPAVSSGLRIGTPALATRGFQVDDFREIGRVIGEALTGDFGDDKRAELSERTRALAERYPLYPHLAPAAV